MGAGHDVSTAYCWSSSGNDGKWLCLIISSTVAVCDWCISILAVVNDWRISILNVLTRSCSLMSLLWYQLPLVLFDHRHPGPSGISIPLSLLILKCHDPNPCDKIVRQTIKLSFQTTITYYGKLFLPKPRTDYLKRSFSYHVTIYSSNMVSGLLRA